MDTYCLDFSCPFLHHSWHYWIQIWIFLVHSCIINGIIGYIFGFFLSVPASLMALCLSKKLRNSANQKIPKSGSTQGQRLKVKTKRVPLHPSSFVQNQPFRSRRTQRASNTLPSTQVLITWLILVQLPGDRKTYCDRDKKPD